MRIFADIPFFFGNAPLVFVTDESAFAGMVDHCSSVLHTLYHSQETAMCPLGLLGRRFSGHGFMLGGCWNALCIQFLCNLRAGLAANHFHENTADYRSGFHVDDKMVLVSRIGFIPVWDCVHKLCLLLFHSHCRLDLLGQVFAVIVVDEVFEGNIHTDSLAFMFRAVISYLSVESDRLAFGEKVANLERVQSKIAELRKSRNASTIRKSKWEYTINELRSLNRSISCGELRCMDCNSTNISFSTGEISQTSYSFDVSTVEMRTEIINSISEKIAAYAEEIQRLSAEICAEQEKMQSLMEDENVSLESIVAYKKDIFSASDAEGRIKDIENEITSLKSQLVANENSSQETQARRVSLLTAILGKMNELYHQIDPDGNLTYTSLFTQRNEVYSGSEATVFHLVKLFALQQVLRHNCPIIVDSFRAEDLSTGKEKTVLEISKSINNQVILTTTLKHEELGKYDSIEGVNHINYISHIPSKILDGRYVADFLGLLSALSIKVQS